MKMSSNFAVWREVLDLRTAPSASQAGAPRVLPPRWISVVESEAMRGFRWGSMSSAVVSLRDWPERENMVGEDMMGAF